MSGADDPTDDQERPSWNALAAEAMVGKLVIVGITRMTADGPEQEQMFGVVKSADATKGFELQLQGTREGETYRLPPHAQNFFPAPPGEYRLRSTGEVVVDPDYTSTWTLYPPEPEVG